MPVIPVIDLGDPRATVVAGVHGAAREHGFFHLVGHGIDAGHLRDLWRHTHAFFALERVHKQAVARSYTNSRGYYDRELTKNRRDLKEVFDFASVPHEHLADDHPRNYAEVDGHNQWPHPDLLPGFRSVMKRHLRECHGVAMELLSVFSEALGADHEVLAAQFGQHNTSFVRLNHYPTSELLTAAERAEVADLGNTALGHHSDAGAFTLLLQDDVGGLQVRRGDAWIDVAPEPGALAVNTGDIAQVWSNDTYVAAVHRVRAMGQTARYSVPYFFNPGYDTTYAPLGDAGRTSPNYRPVNWGEFRRQRAAGDFGDYGAEVQLSDYRI